MASPRCSDWFLGIIAVLMVVSAFTFFVTVGIAVVGDWQSLAAPWICGTSACLMMILSTVGKFVLDYRDKQEADVPLLGVRGEPGSRKSHRCDF